MSTSPVDSCLDGFPIDANVAGPGVRAAFYIQTVSTILFVWLSPKDVSSSHWSMVSTALGLSIAGIITGARREISLVDALIIIDAVLLAFYACDFMNSEFVARMKDVSLLHRRPSALWVICSTLCSLLSCGFGLYVWSTAPTFGSSWDDCNETMKVTFLSLDLKEGRKVQLVLWAVNALLFIRRTWIERWMIIDAAAELFFNKIRELPSNLQLLQRLHKTRPPFWFHFKLWNDFSIKPPRVLLRNFDFIWALTFVTFTIISTEVMIRTYKREHNLNTGWNFGQALPVLLTLSPVFSLLEALTKGAKKDKIQASDPNTRRDPQKKAKHQARVALARQFSATLFLALWLAPTLRKEMTDMLNMNQEDLKAIEIIIAEAYERWDRDGRIGDLDDAWDHDEEQQMDDDAKFKSIYFDAESHFSMPFTCEEIPSIGSSTTLGFQFASILWEALYRIPALKETLIKNNVVDNQNQLDGSLKVVVMQTWDLWKAHRDRTRRFRWWAVMGRPREGIMSAVALVNRRVVAQAAPAVAPHQDQGLEAKQ
ncbi:hypothetical protein FA15DRAFT_648037 [Coprinopsis marcescibilis]|uniref:Uncharacterized protein n=1 Tax=Coprinopsis marcescibilis TaxID=230819 RepID=A0A5C3KHP7_COPMA|nr:hypothetical protein FA15DRAFT_648037 [Coprinopsis marcescibilis]